MEKAGIDSMNTRGARRDQIAEAGIRLIARRGVRALTHRAVDEEAHLPKGSTSYYARTRRALVGEIVRLLAEHSIADLESAARALSLIDGASSLIDGASEPTGRDELLHALVGAVDALARRPDELKVRCALLLELDHDDPARATLVDQSPVQQQMARGLADALDACGISAATDRARDLMSLCDALLMRSVITGAPVQIAPILSAHLNGVIDSAAGSR